MAREDLELPDLEELDWSTEHRSEALSAVYRHAIGIAKSAEEWYERERPGKSRWGRVLRVGAIVLAGVAAVLPILTQITTNDNGPTIAPGWAAVALAAAATLVALDRLLGFSSAWMRFMRAELKVASLRLDFEYQWQTASVRAGTPPSDEEVAAMLEHARNFVRAVDAAVAEETAAWTTEFQSSLQRAERSLDSDRR